MAGHAALDGDMTRRDRRTGRWHFAPQRRTPICTPRAATVLAHENTKTRMAEPHDSALLGLHIPASPADALPQQTFSASQKLQANGEIVDAAIFPGPGRPTRTSTFTSQKANVIHMGDTFLRLLPVIDASTGGKIDG